MTPIIEFSGRTAIVTGGGSGIGRGMALRFADAGAKVLVADISEAGAQETCALIEAEGGIALPHLVDVGDEASVAAMVDAAMAAWGRIDVLCNNAGVMDRLELAGDVSTAQWDRVLRINLSGVMFGSRAVLPHMLAAGSGVIINTASGAGLRGGAAGAAYTAAKHGVVGLTKNIGWAYRQRGIRCNAICPGAVATNVTGGGGLASLDPAGLEISGPVIGLNVRIAEPDQMATVALFLASDAAAFVTGAVIPVDDGWAAA